MKKLGLILTTMIACSMTGQAAPVALRWDPPTHTVETNPIPPELKSEIVTRVYATRYGQSEDWQVIHTVTNTAAAIVNLPIGIWRLRVTAALPNTAESDPSNEAGPKVYAKVMAASNLTVIVTTE
jgi:hypothetical protein